jgi:hypothetical protein
MNSKESKNSKTLEKKYLKKKTFESFQDFWRNVRELEDSQREKLFNSLSQEEQKDIQNSYDSGGWEDLFMRNKIDKILDKIKKDTGIDLVDIRCKVVVKNKSFYINKNQWDHVCELIRSSVDKNKQYHTNYVLDGIDSVEESKGTVLLTKKNNGKN